MTFWCKRGITKTSACAEMLHVSRSVTARLREQFCGYLLIEPGEIFLPSDWDFLGNWEKRRTLGMGVISDPGDREKRP